MIGDEKLFSTYNPSYKNLTMRIANGSLSKVAGTGSVRVSKNIPLDSVLLVPKLNCNLLSISKLTWDLNCVTKFGSNLCEFQVLDLGKTIGNAKMCSGLYLLEVNDPPQGSTHHSDCSVSSSPISLSFTKVPMSTLLSKMGEAILTTAYLINRMPSRILDFQTPCQILLQSFPNLVSSPQSHSKFLGAQLLSMSITNTGTNLILELLNVFSLESPSQDQTNNPPTNPPPQNLDTIQSTNNDELITYSRRRKNQKEMEQQASLEQTQESDPSSRSSEDPSGNYNPETNDDSDFPIAVRKCVRSCTKHPIYTFVSYEGLSPKFKTFVANLDNIQVPNNIQEALDSPKWKSAVYEEIHALEKNGTWEISELPAGKRLGIDYEETFAPIAKLNIVRVLLSLAANLDWPLHQIDVKNAFLNGDLAKEVYMEIPPGFETQTTRNKVCKRRRSLYGLKQSPRAWFERFTKVVKKHGYSQEFEIKDLGNLKYFLGMEIARSRKGIFVSQRKYVLDLLKETRMLGCKPADTPMDPTTKLGAKENCAPVDKGRYQRLVEHMEVVYRILRYLKVTPGKGLFFEKNQRRDIEVFSDADWAGSVQDRRSTSGYYKYVWGNLVTWRSKKQSMVSKSSAEAEFRAMAHDICEGI
ncbi:Retrovirus-related Pol polyprotein from transposon RE1 [Vitis vinifera]|uniref:Retrovirus-related Pol polyprotein from transposon RE1 n=1 Tax=Vitis vinifera TaxID=29760 RepID=A0A438G744_VITVI|nr:Retrovirus-related Pol polyprotein from transposon RE1 [Vitis vinifera]